MSIEHAKATPDPPRILVVDDSAPVRKGLAKLLEPLGAETIEAPDGRHGFELAQRTSVDLVISDVDMPGLDGIELCRRLKSASQTHTLPIILHSSFNAERDIDMPIMNGFELCQAVRSDASTAEIPFVVMSANSDRGTMKRMLQRGAAAYITKPFNVDELVILTDRILSDQVRLLLKEKERLDFERRHMLESISSLIMALEARDTYTRGHSEAVGRIVSGMVALTGASQQEIDRATIGGRLHNIGKIGIRDAVLLKPGKLSDAEFDQIKQHPLIGAKILQSIESLADTRDIVLSHHERLDGRGYPQGLVGDGIPLLARMTAVADTFHALTSDRPYRKGLPLEKSLAIIDEARGTQLCPDCVDLFHKFLASDRADQEASQR
ncbi:MAG: response regulator [Desulfobacterales bacterium]|jgi:response regulator RpfG family c-di-GMP phosphodiesterase